MAEVFGEFYVDTTTGRQQVPQYDAWFKWTKFGTNIASAILAVGTILVEIGEDTLSESWGITTFFVLAAVVRVVEVVKETVPLVCGQTVPHLPWCCEWVPVVGFAGRLYSATSLTKACCRRPHQARDADRIQKYVSSLLLSPILAGLAIALFALKTSVLGGLVTGIVCVLDALMGLWVVWRDEVVKDFRRVRQRPADFELDDALDDPAEGEQIGLTAMPAPISAQASSFTYGNNKAPGAGIGEASADGGLRAGSHTQKGKFNMANWEQPDEL